MRTPAKSITGIQILRGLAALAVVVHHSMEECRMVSAWIPDSLVLIGASGVDVFFVISGFLMLHTTLSQEAGWLAGLNFLKRRIHRIFPLYWTWLLLLLALGASGRIYRSLHTGLWQDLAAFLLLPIKPTIIGVSWTLSYEMYFYLLFAACLFFVSPRWRYLAIMFSIPSILLIGMISKPWLGFMGPFLSNPITLEFCFGASIAALAEHARCTRWVGLLAVAFGTVVLLLASTRVYPTDTTGPPDARYVVWGLPAALVVYGMLSVGSSLRSSLMQNFLLRLGDASYSIYLTHPTVLIVLATMLKNGYFRHLNGLVPILLATVASILLGFIVHTFIEKPLLNAAKRRWLKPAPKTPSIEPAIVGELPLQLHQLP